MDGMRTKSILINGSLIHAFMRLSVAAGRGRSKPVHKPADGHGYLRLGRQVPMIRHDAVGINEDRKPFHGLMEYFKDLKIIVRV